MVGLTFTCVPQYAERWLCFCLVYTGTSFCTHSPKCIGSALFCVYWELIHSSFYSWEQGHLRRYSNSLLVRASATILWNSFFLSSVLKSFHSGLLYVFLQEPKYHRRLCLNFWIFNYYYFFVKMRSSTKLLSWLQCRLSGAGWNSACICNCIYVAGLRFIGSRCHWHFVIILCESFVLWVWPWIATCVSLVCMCSRIPELLVFEWCLAYLDETRISLFISIWLWGLVCDLYLGEENWCIG